MYEQIVQRNGFQIALEAKFRRYSGPPEEITYERVACHFAECGVSFQMATQELGPWAQECVAASGTQ
jgi:hypothetical protein